MNNLYSLVFPRFSAYARATCFLLAACLLSSKTFSKASAKAGQADARTATTGAYIKPLAEIKGAKNAPSDHGVVVFFIAPNSPATEAGLKLYDLIVSINGKLVSTHENFSDIMQTLTPGKPCEIELFRKTSQGVSGKWKQASFSVRPVTNEENAVQLLSSIHVEQGNYTLYAHRLLDKRVTIITPELLIDENKNFTVNLHVNFLGNKHLYLKDVTLKAKDEVRTLDFVSGIKPLRTMEKGKHREWRPIVLSKNDIAWFEAMLDEPTLNIKLNGSKGNVDCTWSNSDRQWMRDFFMAYRLIQRDHSHFKKVYKGPRNSIK